MKQPHKIDKNKVLYFNGKRWLIKETCKTNKEAIKLLKEIEKQNAIREIS